MSKAIAVMDEPKSCDECIFARCKYSLPLSTNRRGYYCQLKEPKDRVVEDFACDEEMHLSNCPLKSNYEQEIRNKVITEFAEKFIYKAVCEGCSGCCGCYEEGKQSECEHWKSYMEIAEQMKGDVK